VGQHGAGHRATVARELAVGEPEHVDSTLLEVAVARSIRLERRASAW
jgi:hypothetical protein